MDRKIGVPGARLTWYAGAWTTDAVWNPFYTALRLPHDQDRWFPPLLQFPDHATTPLGTVPVEAHYPDVEAPPHTLASSDAAIRVGRQVGNAAITASLFHGWDKTATFAAGGTATVVPTGDPALPAAPSIDIDIRPTLHRVTVVGADLAVPVWLARAPRRGAPGFTAGSSRCGSATRSRTDPGLVTTVRDTVGRVARSGIAETVALPSPLPSSSATRCNTASASTTRCPERSRAGCQHGEALAGTFLLLQLIETVIFDHDAPFLADQVEHVLGLTLRQSFRDERLTTELKLAYNPNHGDYYVWPQITYRIAENWHALFEARVIGGDPTRPSASTTVTTASRSVCSDSFEEPFCRPRRSRICDCGSRGVARVRSGTERIQDATTPADRWSAGMLVAAAFGMTYSYFERLSALDGSFLAIENGASHMHIGSVALFERGPFGTADGGVDIERIRSLMESELHRVPRYRQRLAHTPIFAQPVWVDDQHFNLAYHIRHTHLPRPGDERQLKRLAARLMSQELDRGKPLWEMWVVEGLDGRPLRDRHQGAPLHDRRRRERRS